MWLVFETSTSRCSLALMDGTAVCREESWLQDRSRSPKLFSLLRRLLKDGALSVKDIEAFGVGLGPGAFSSLRMALTVAQAMALPDGRPVIGVSSAEALARDMAARHHLDSAAVVGNARRERFWVATYGATRRPDTGFQLVSAEELPARLREEPLVVSPDWDTLEPLLRQAVPDPARLIQEAAVPTASAVGRIARSLAGSNPAQWAKVHQSAGPLSPIYLHPAVMAPARAPKPS